MMRRLVVLPTYEEADNIETVLTRIRGGPVDLDVLVVDDSSPDGTADTAEKLNSTLGGIEVLRRPGKQGLGAAYRAGFAWGLERGYDVLIEMDADLSHDADDLPRLCAAVDDGADLAIGSRYMPGGSIPDWSWHRRALSRYGNQYAVRLLRLQVTDATSGFRAYRAPALARIDLDRVRADGYGFQIEMVRSIVRTGGQVTEIPIVFAPRVYGQSKMSTTIVAEAMVWVTAQGISDRVRRRPARP